MGHSRLPLIALLGAVGCTQQNAPPSERPPPPEPSPQEKEQAPGTSVRAVSAEERQQLFPSPPPEAPVAQTAPAAETPAPVPEAKPPDYAEERRQQYHQTRYGKGSGVSSHPRIEIIKNPPEKTDSGKPSRGHTRN